MKLPLDTSIFEVHHYAFVNTHKITIEIKVHSLFDGVADKYNTMAYPVNSIGRHGKKEFRATGETVENAVYNCAEKLKDIKDLNQIFPS